MIEESLQSSESDAQKPSASNRAIMFIALLACGLAVFLVPNLMEGNILSGNFKTVYMTVLPIAFLVLSAWMRKNEGLRKYFDTTFAFFIASLVYGIASPWGGGTTVENRTVNVVVYSILVVVPLLVLSRATSRSLDSIYVKTGNLRSGLLIGAITFLFFLVTCVPASVFVFGGQEPTSEQLMAWAPWLAVFIFVNALKEELLWRGLFLRKYETFVGYDPANLLQAIIFGFAHFYTSSNLLVPLVLVVIAFVLGLGFGAAMQKTDSIIAPILFHAGSDIPFLIAVFSVL